MGADVAQGTELAVILQLEDFKRFRHDLFFLSIVRGGDTVENFEFGQRSGATGSLVGQHTTDSSPEDSGRGLVVLDPAAGVVTGCLI